MSVAWPASFHYTTVQRPVSSIQVRCNRSHVRVCQASQYHSTLIIRPSLHSPFSIKQLVNTSPANACFKAVGILGKGWACVIVADDREGSRRSRVAIGRSLLAESGRRMQAHGCQEGRLNTVWEGARWRRCKERGSSAVRGQMCR